MLWYVAIIAVLNLALGYVWGAYFRSCPRCAKIRELGAVLSSVAAQTTEERSATPIENSFAGEQSTGPPPVPEPIVSEVAATETPAETEALLEQPELPVIPRDPATGLATREYAEQLLGQLAETDTQKDPVTVALVEVEPVDWIGDRLTSVIDERLLSGVSIIVRESLASDHTAARFAGQQLLLLVPHEDVHQATRRTEEMRQRIANTEFLADGRSVHTTVTCALTDVSKDRSGTKLFEFLQEALSEAKRYGGNRTFMHDGNSPTPVVPPELEVAPQQLAI